MNVARAKLLFDLNGFVRIPQVLSKAQVEAANAAIDAHEFVERKGNLRNSKSDTAFSGDMSTGRFDMAGMLGWDAPHREPFREMLCNPKLVPFLHQFVGKGYRLDHSPLVLSQTKGSEGFSLHGGPLLSDGRMNPHLQYVCQNSEIYNTLIAVSFQLSDCNKGDGGFCVVKGSHKMNFAPTADMMNGEDQVFLRECVEQPETQAGDVIIFSEATIHGCLPWTASHERRIALYRFAPSNLAFARGYSAGWPETFTAGMSPEQLAVMQPPFHPMYDRDCLEVMDGRLEVVSDGRSHEKKQFDQQVFNQPYY